MLPTFMRRSEMPASKANFAQLNGVETLVAKNVRRNSGGVAGAKHGKFQASTSRLFFSHWLKNWQEFAKRSHSEANMANQNRQNKRKLLQSLKQKPR